MTTLSLDQSIDNLARIPRLPIAVLPTPVQELTRLRAFLGPTCPRLLVKRDDLTGLALGGNKARKLEFLLADARRSGADTLITCGAAQSNHALQTAAAGREYGFNVRCVLYGAAPTPNSIISGNMLLHDMLDTPIRWVRMQDGETRREQALRRGILEETHAAEADGHRVYAIPTGGSTAMGALGYVRAVLELCEQLGVERAKTVRAFYFASGSGGTHAGMVVGAWLAELDVRCVGVEVDPIPADANGMSPFQRAIVNLTQETADLLQINRQVTPADIELDGTQTGPAYGSPTPEGRDAAHLLFRTEGILLDPVYTATAFSAVLAAVKRGDFGPDDTVVFWHTGGAAGIFAGHG